MHKSAYNNTEKFYKKYCEQNIESKKILDVGSYNVNGSVKPIFKKGKYVGVDMCKGPNVDIVANCNDMPFEKNHFDIIVSISCFEHDDMFWSTFLEMLRVLKPGGYIYVNAPSNGPYHAHPGDNWRFYADSWRALERWGKTNGYDVELIESYIDNKKDVKSGEIPDVWNDSIGIFKKREVKKVSLISSFCDTQEKIDILKKNISTVKSLNIDVIVISPFYLEREIVEMCDYFFVTKDNPVLDWPEKAMYMWKILSKEKEKIKITTTYSDYGFAGLTQVKQLSEIALNFEYEQFYHMIYDLKIDENVISGLNSYESNSIYPSKRGETIWDVGLHFMIFDRENLKKFISKITKENYLVALGTDAFGWLHRNQKDLNYKIEKTPVEDVIYYYQEHDFFNYSEIPNVKFFIEKNDETLESIKLLFYDVKEKFNIEIKIDGSSEEQEIENLSIIDLKFNKTNPKNVSLIYNSKEYEITSKVNKVKHNTLTTI